MCWQCRRPLRALRKAWFTWPTSRPPAAAGEPIAGTPRRAPASTSASCCARGVAPADILWLSLAAGLAVRDAVRQVTALDADIRWPNDLLLGRKKFCGILTELNAEVTRVRHAVVGIGINVHQESFPAELSLVASSLRSETGRSWPRQDLLIALLQSLYREAQALSAEPTGAALNILRRFEGASSWIRGRHVRVDEAEGYSGVTAGLDARGFLQVRTPQGLRTVHSGGVRDDD